MNRRSFFKLTLATGAGLAIEMALDPELALWVPGAKTVFLPPPSGWAPSQGAVFDARAQFMAGDIVTLEGHYELVRDERTHRWIPTSRLSEFVVRIENGQQVFTPRSQAFGRRS